MIKLKDCLVFLFCAGGGWAVPILINEFGIMKVGEGLAILLIFTVSIGLRFLWEYLEGLIVNLMKDEKEKEQIHFQKWRVEVTKLLYSDSLGSVKYKECCELMDKICKDKHLSLEYKKELYDRVCLVWAEVDEDKRCIVYHPVPPEIQMKWKKAQADDKLRQLKKDF